MATPSPENATSRAHQDADVIPPHTKKRTRDSIFCDHCNRVVSKSTFYRHYEQFYDHLSNTWQQSTTQEPAVNENRLSPSSQDMDTDVPGNLSKAYMRLRNYTSYQAMHSVLVINLSRLGTCYNINNDYSEHTSS